MIHSPECVGAIVPRAAYNPRERCVEALVPEFRGTTDAASGTFTSVLDNYLAGTADPAQIRVPSLLTLYVNDWKQAAAGVRNFVAEYLGVKTSKSYADPAHIDAVRQSVCIVVTPVEQPVPPELAPYVRTVRLPKLSDQEIEWIVSDKLAADGISSDAVDQTLLNQLIVNFRGFSARSIRNAVGEMTARQAIDFDSADSRAALAIIRSAKKQMLEASLGLKWESPASAPAAGLEGITDWLRARVEIFRDPEGALRQHIDIPKGLLVSGVPGSGKSLMAKTAARLLDLPLISLDMGALLGGLVGESEHNMINALAMAEQTAPCVLWIDEIEKAFSGSGASSASSDGGVGRRMFGRFLTWMQEKEAACFVFATSNDISSLPPELFRSERFDRKFFTFMPMAADCARIFASNIAAQNAAYRAELAAMPARIASMQASRLFAQSLESPEVWLRVLNDCCAEHPAECRLVNISDGPTPRWGWNGPARPRHKLLTGADISALIREAKFAVHSVPSLGTESTVYAEGPMLNAVRAIMRSRGFKPYGETNLADIVACFLKLQENEFVAASSDCIIDFDRYDADNALYCHTEGDEDKLIEPYDRVLYYTIVGAINHYAKPRKNQ